MIQSVGTKDPDSIELFTFDFSLRLSELDGDALATLIAVAIDDGGSGLTLGAIAMSSPYVTVWMSGGTLGTIYTVRARVTTAPQGRTLDMSMKLQIAED